MIGDDAQTTQYHTVVHFSWGEIGLALLVVVLVIAAVRYARQRYARRRA